MPKTAKYSREADITISGQKLSESQSMTVRVALQTFGLTLQEDGLGPDARHLNATEGYLRCITQINAMIAKTAV